jgi:hypothetical protein
MTRRYAIYPISGVHMKRLPKTFLVLPFGFNHRIDSLYAGFFFIQTTL